MSSATTARNKLRNPRTGSYVVRGSVPINTKKNPPEAKRVGRIRVVTNSAGKDGR